MLILRIVYFFFAFLVLLTVALPLVRHNYWVFRVFDYPRFQKFCLLLILSIVWFVFLRDAHWFDYTVLGLIAASLIYLGVKIFPYTPFAQKMIQQVKLKKDEKALSILVCNVYQDNTNYAKMAQLIRDKNADVVFLLETNKAWQEGVKSATDAYPYRIEVPLENTYGLLLYSHLPIENEKVHYLISTDIPSVVFDIRYQNQRIRMYGIHPTPPVPQENTESTERDAEILMVGKMAEEYRKPSIVFGDLNDVAWSRTTRLFLKASGMLDPRRGRGFYNTFHVKYWFCRWPLDHFFVSPHFRLIKMAVEKSVDSDHFPISISLVLRSEDDSEALDTNHEEELMIEEKIEEGIEKGDAN